MKDVRMTMVIPAYNVDGHIAGVLREIPRQIGRVIVVDDASTDRTASMVEECARTDSRIQLIRRERNGGVGAAMVTGFREALEEGTDIVVKVDGDGQMPLDALPRLLAPLLCGEADYVKGNRFRDLDALGQMPPLRRLGNVVLSFLAKAATGYWNCFDPTNGYVAIRAEVLAQIPLDRLDPGYFFETSMLSQLYLRSAVVREEPIPARYNGEPSSLSLPRAVADFPGRLLYSFARRIILKNFVYDFNVQSLELLASIPLLLFGILYGGYHWIWFASRRLPAPVGTVVLPALTIILGFQLLLSAISLDLQSVPRQPINSGPLV